MFKRREPFRVGSSTRRTSSNWTLFSAIADAGGWPFVTTLGRRVGDRIAKDMKLVSGDLVLTEILVELTVPSISFNLALSTGILDIENDYSFNLALFN